MKFIIPLLVVLAMSGCLEHTAMSPAAAPITPFKASDFDWVKKPGSGAISGQAFLKTRGGDVKYGAGNEVMLIPSPGFFAERFLQGLSGSRVVPLTPEEKSYIKTTTADGGGNFEFTNVPSGDYIVACNITWLAGRYYTGGYATANVKLGEGESKKVIASQ